jgi:hypothetical protein
MKNWELMNATECAHAVHIDFSRLTVTSSIYLHPGVNNRDVEGVIYTRLCSQSNAEILFT